MPRSRVGARDVSVQTLGALGLVDSERALEGVLRLGEVALRELLPECVVDGHDVGNVALDGLRLDAGGSRACKHECEDGGAREHAETRTHGAPV